MTMRRVEKISGQNASVVLQGPDIRMNPMMMSKEAVMKISAFFIFSD